MAPPIFEIEPNYFNLEDLDHVDETSVIESTLDSVANQVNLGDTNSAVPGRLLGRVEAYEEAGASKYIVVTATLHETKSKA